ncbi:MAG: DNA mismatch repair endonuclease MutL [Pseudomonadota bacterium]|nr:DNA mismatch repair endonuclease MutL [Pseudomonadota bacterium]
MKNIPLAKTSNKTITEKEEYIKNPSQILRELIENSIDAESSKINIKIDRGGLGLIEVKDNGIGMNPQEMLLSIDRKSYSQNNTNKLFGTNGDMLHQISKIAKIELICKEKNKTRGSILKVSNKKIQPVKECYADIGTKIQIRDLFYNKSKIRQLTKDTKIDDFSHIVNTYAIAFPKIGFTARINGKDILNVPIEDKLSKDPFISRIKSVLGKNVSNSMIKFSNEIDDIKVSILLTNQKQSFKKDNYQFIFVNQKPVQEIHVKAMINDLYQKSFDIKDYPAFFVFLDIHNEYFAIKRSSKNEINFKEEKVIKILKSILLNGFSKEIFNKKIIKNKEIDLSKISIALHDDYEIKQSKNGLIIKDRKKNKKIEISLSSIKSYFK